METIMCFSLLTCLMLVLNSIAFANGEKMASIPPGCFPKIYAFGDSLTDTGNTRSGVGPSNFQGVSHAPYGQTYFHRPTNRYSDGRLVIDFVAQALGLPLLQPYLNGNGDFGHGVNFAVAGSTALNHEFFTERNITLDQTPQSLATQLQWHNQFLDKICHTAECKYKTSAGALYWVGEIGANDYAYILGSDISSQTIRTLAVSKTLHFLEALIEQGARYMVVEGIPMTGCLAMSMVLGADRAQDGLGCIKSVNEDAQLHNAMLQQGLEELRQKYPAATIIYADYYSAHTKVMQNPSLYGFNNSRTTCCGAGGGAYNFDIFATCGEDERSPFSGEKATACADPSKYINWDGIHFTEAMNSVIANMFLHGEFTSQPFSFLLEKKKCLS